MRTAVLVLAVAALGGAFPLAALAQGRPGGRPAARSQPARRDTVPRPAGDSVRIGKDTTEKRELVKWVEEDSVTRALLARDSITATRYQADEVVFQANGRQIILNGNAAVQRDESIIVSDTILYSDSTKVVLALGDAEPDRLERPLQRCLCL